MPILLDCNFIVDSTNGNGLGLRSLKGPYIQNAFMHTTVTPGVGNSNPATPGLSVTNPNPASGTIVIQFQDSFSRTYTGGNAIISPVGTSQVISSGLTAGIAYTITVVGDATAANWLAIGVPAGLISQTAPFVQIGTSFIASSTGAGSSSTSMVAPTAATGSGVATIETVGNSSIDVAPNPAANQGFGGQLILQCRDYAGALVAPADGSVISLSFLLSNSSILINGE